MPNSATHIQKTFKQEVNTLFVRASIGAGGAVTLVTADGASKEATINRDATGSYVVAWPELPVQQFLGAPVLQILNSSTASNGLYVATAKAESVSVSGLQFQVWNVSGSVQSIAEPPSGSQLQITAFMTTSPVY